MNNAWNLSSNYRSGFPRRSNHVWSDHPSFEGVNHIAMCSCFCSIRHTEFYFLGILCPHWSERYLLYRLHLPRDLFLQPKIESLGSHHSRWPLFQRSCNEHFSCLIKHDIRCIDVDTTAKSHLGFDYANEEEMGSFCGISSWYSVSLKGRQGLRSGSCLLAANTANRSCGSSTVRLYFTIEVWKTHDVSYYMGMVGVWTYPEITFGFLVACLPIMPKFLRVMAKKPLVGRVGTGLRTALRIPKSETRQLSRHLNRNNSMVPGRNIRTRTMQISDVEFHELVLSTENKSIARCEYDGQPAKVVMLGPHGSHPPPNNIVCEREVEVRIEQAV